MRRPGKPIRVQLADDHEIVRVGFRHLLEMEGDMQVVAESAGGRQACRDYEACRPDILIMDISMPDISGLDAMRRVLQSDPKARILILSMHTGVVAEHAMQQGARGFVCKRSGAAALLAAIRCIMRGGRYVDDKADAGTEAKPDIRHGNRPTLSKRELEICILLSAGQSVAEIAKALYLSDKTVYTHRHHIMEKLGVSNQIELAQVAARMGIGSD